MNRVLPMMKCATLDAACGALLAAGCVVDPAETTETLTAPIVRGAESNHRAVVPIAGVGGCGATLIAQISELAALPQLEEVHIYESYLEALRPALASSSLPFVFKAIYDAVDLAPACQ